MNDIKSQKRRTIQKVKKYKDVKSENGQKILKKVKKAKDLKVKKTKDLKSEKGRTI